MLELIYTVIFIAFLYWLCNHYGYWTNVIAYTIVMGLIYTLLFNYTTFFSLIIAIVLNFIIGAIIIWLLNKINDYFQNAIVFLLGGLALQYFVVRFVVAFILTFIAIL